MRKFALFCVVGLVAFSASAGAASGAAKTTKTDILLITGTPAPAEFLALANDFDGLIIIEDQKETRFEDIYSLLITKDMIAPAPVAFEYARRGDLQPYKEKGQIKTKYHADHLFNPVKRC